MSPSSRPEPLSAPARIIEAILFVSSVPVSAAELADVLSLRPADVRAEVDRLNEHLLRHGHGLTVTGSPGGWRMATSEEVSVAVGAFRETSASQKTRLSKAAVETLAVIAYNQPVTRSEVEEIRGVRCERVIETLLSHGLIRIAGRRRGTGSPLLYRTTEQFLETFGVAAISELPTLEELDELAPRGETREDMDDDDYSE